MAARSDNKGYVLESENEAFRLEKQALYTHYRPSTDYSEELLRKPFSKILDAGCGSGVVCRFLQDKYPLASIQGCDISNERIEHAKKLALEFSKDKINFFVSGLESIQAPSESYDLVTSRYVFHHLTDPKKVCEEFFRLTKPGGSVYLVDMDGLVVNFHSENAELMKSLKKIEAAWGTDLFVARKMPALLKSSGFEIQSVEIKLVTFKGQTLLQEIELMTERFQLLFPYFENILGSRQEAQKFCDLYLEEMKSSSSTLYYNKFLVTAKKVIA